MTSLRSAVFLVALAVLRTPARTPAAWKVDLSSARAEQQRLSLDFANNRQRVVDGSFRFVYHSFRPSTHEDAYSLGVLASFDKGHLVVRDFPFLNEGRTPQVRGLQSFELC